MSLQTTLTKLKTEGLLTPAEQRLTDILMGDPAGFSGMSVGELSERAKTSVATVSRYAQKLGYSKLTDLKLAASTFQRESFTYRNIPTDGTTASRIARVAQFERDTIESVQSVLKPESLEEACRMIDAAGQLVFAGCGGSYSAAMDACHKFLRTGKSCQCFADGHELIIAASTAGANVVFLIFSDSGETPELNKAVQIAKENKAGIIAVTRSGSSKLKKMADVSLHTLTAEKDEEMETLISRVAAYTVIDMLYVEYYAGHAEKIEALQKKINKQLKHS